MIKSFIGPRYFLRHYGQSYWFLVYFLPSNRCVTPRYCYYTKPRIHIVILRMYIFTYKLYLHISIYYNKKKKKKHLIIRNKRDYYLQCTLVNAGRFQSYRKKNTMFICVVPYLTYWLKLCGNECNVTFVLILTFLFYKVIFHQKVVN